MLVYFKSIRKFFQDGSQRKLRVISKLRNGTRYLVGERLEARTLLAGVYENAVLADSPTVYYRLGDTPPAPAISDASGHGLSGSLLNSVSLGQSGALTSDSTNSAARFNTTEDGVLIGDNNLLTLGVAATIEAWIRPDQASNGQYQNLYSKYDYQNGQGVEFEFLIHPSGQLYFNRGGAIALSSISVTASVWQHVAVTVNSGSVVFYINGVVRGGGNVASSSSNTAAPVQIGTARGTPFQFRGLMDEVAVYSSALSQPQILSHVQAAASGSYATSVLATNPVGYWRLGDAPPISDLSGNKISGTLLNGISLGQVGALAGDSNTAARFAAGGDGVLIADTNQLTPGNAVTFEVWIKPDSAANGDYQNLFSKYDYTVSALGTEYELLLNASGRLYFGRGGVALSSVPIASGVWQHVVVTVNSGSVAFFINGAPGGSGSVSTGFANTSAPVQIGTARSTPYQFRGLIDEVAVYPSVLSLTRIQAHYLAGTNFAPTGVSITSAVVAENQIAGTSIGTLNSTDLNAADTFIYSLVTGNGSADNGVFTIVGSQLIANSSFNFESKSSYAIRVRTTDSGGLSFEKELTITVENVLEMPTPVQIGDGTTQRSVVNKLVVPFDQAIEFDAGAFQVYQRVKDSNNALVLVPVTTNVTLAATANGMTATLTFSGSLTRAGTNALLDGNYQLSINGGLIRILNTTKTFDADGDGNGGGLFTLGNQAADNFFALLGDANGNGEVDAQDLLAAKLALRKTVGQSGYNSAYDVNGNGVVDAQDILNIQLNLRKKRVFF